MEPIGHKLRLLLSKTQTWLVIFGVSLAMVANHSRRLVTNTNYVDVEEYLNTILVVVLLLGVALLYYKRPSFRFSDSRLFLAAFGVVMTVTMLLYFGILPSWISSDLPIGQALLFCFKLGCAFLYLLWFEQLRRVEARTLFLLAGCTLAVTCAFETLGFMLHETFERFFLTIAPATSLVLLAIYRSWPDRDVLFEMREIPSRYRIKHPRLTAGLLCGAFFLYSSTFGYMVFVMEGFQRSGYPVLASRVAGSLALLLCALLFILMAMPRRWEGFARDAVYLLIPCLALVYLLSVLNPANLQFFFLHIVGLIQNFPIIFVLFGLLFFEEHRLPLVAVNLAVYKLARLGFVILQRGAVTLGSDLYNTLMIIVLVAAVAVSYALVSQLFPHSAGHTYFDESGEQAEEAPSVPQGMETTVSGTDMLDIRAAALAKLSQRYSLTEREADILSYLADGWRATSIAEKLTLSPATVKNHMNRIYNKMNVHSQQEVLLMFEKEETVILSSR